MRKDASPEGHDRRELIDEEVLLIGHSGEIPEVALHSSLFHLGADPGGPGLTLTPEEADRLKNAVIAQYRRIILRDLTPRLRETRVYRGIGRCVVNWERLSRFLQREGRSPDGLRSEIGEALGAFCRHLQAEAAAGRLRSGVDLSPARLEAFGAQLGLPPKSLDADRICRR